VKNFKAREKEKKRKLFKPNSPKTSGGKTSGVRRWQRTWSGG